METLNALETILNITGTLGLSVLGMFAVAWVNANTTPTTGAFSSPATGLMIYDTTVNKVSVYNGSIWKYLQYE